MKKEYLPCIEKEFIRKYPCYNCKTTEKCMLSSLYYDNDNDDVICEKCGEVVAENVAPDNHNKYLDNHICFNF